MAISTDRVRVGETCLRNIHARLPSTTYQFGGVHIVLLHPPEPTTKHVTHGFR